jgi:phosphoglucosamine mutase
MSRLFGTDGVRGIANQELTASLAHKLGKAGAHILKKNENRPVVLIGKDTRISGDMLEDALSAGILSMGGNVIKAGVLPTPAVAYLVRQFGADAGVVISASHNSFEHNGIKLFNGDGYKLDDNLEEEIEDIIARDLDISSHITGDRLGRVLQPKEDAEELYAGFLKNTVDADLSGMSVVIDCANGAASRIAEKVLADLGMRLRVIHNEPDGVNINKNCGSTHPGDLQEAVRREGAALGLAFDGDADRLIAVGELGQNAQGSRGTAVRPGDDDRHEQPRVSSSRRIAGAPGGHHAGGRPLRARAHARHRLRNRRRAVRAHHIPQAHDDRRRHPLRAAASAGVPDGRTPAVGHGRRCGAVSAGA